MRDSDRTAQALAAEALGTVVVVLSPSFACARIRGLKMSEEDLLTAACIHLAPALIQAAGPSDAGASGAFAAAVLEELTLSACNNAAVGFKGHLAAATTLLRTYCEGIACCQDKFSYTVHRVEAAAKALRYGLAALRFPAEAEACQRLRQRRHAKLHPAREVCQTAIMVYQAAAALAAVVLQCAAAGAVALAQSRAAKTCCAETTLT